MEQELSYEEKREKLNQAIVQVMMAVFKNRWFTQGDLEKNFKISNEDSTQILQELQAFNFLEIEVNNYRKKKNRFKLLVSNEDILKRIQSDLNSLRNSFKKQEEQLLAEIEKYSAKKTTE